MSEMAYVDGWYDFADKDALEDALAKLRHGGWIGNGLDEEDIVKKDNILVIPFGSYRNLHRHLSDFGEHADTYHVVSASSDGYLMGWVDASADGLEIDLNEWAVDNGFDDPPNADEEFEEYVEWSEEVMTAFMSDHRLDAPEQAFA